MSLKNRQRSYLLISIATILVQTGAVFACEPKLAEKQGETVTNLVEITVSPEMIQNSTQEIVTGLCDTDYLSDKYTLLSNEFHRILEEEGGEISIHRLQFLLSSARDFEQRATRIQKPYWIRQFKVLSTSLEVAIELSQARDDRDEHKKSHEEQ